MLKNSILYDAPSVAPLAHTGGVRLPRADTSVSPSENFYKHINNTWQRHVHMPSYEGDFGVSEEIESEIQTELLSIIQRLQSKNPTHPLAVLATSFFHTAAQINSIIDIQRILSGFQCITDNESLASTIGFLNNIQCRAPLSFTISSDPYDSSKCSNFLYEPHLGLPEKHHYGVDRSGGVGGRNSRNSRNPILLKYKGLLTELGKLLHVDALESAVTIEQSILPFLARGGDLGDIDYYYNPHTLEELQAKYKDIPWTTMLEAWGLKERVYSNATFIVTNMKYVRHINTMFQDYDTFRIWMSSMVVLQYLEYLPPPYDDLHFELFGKALKGIAKKLPQKYLTLKVLKTFAPQALGELYVRNEVPVNTKPYVTRLVHKLVTATLERLQVITWMSPETKRAALRKVRAMKLQIGYPEKWESEVTDVSLNAERPLSNILTLCSADTANMITDLTRGCKKRVEKWDDGVFEVNAYYYMEGNMMVVPVGILRAPFLDLKRSKAWNYGGIGSAIGHEITHGFDEDGRFYDEHGNYKNWWSVHDAHMFDKLAQSLIDFYDGAEYMGGKVDGELTLSENLADLGGLAISLHALQSELPKDTATRKKAYVDFFTSYAVSWRNKDRAKKAKEALTLDVHAPARLRVNFVVHQFAEFYEAFDIGPEEAGFIPPEKRIRLW